MYACMYLVVSYVPRLCGYMLVVSTTRMCTIFIAMRSQFRECPAIICTARMALREVWVQAKVRVSAVK